jgi:mevalonate kinase
LIEGNTQDFYVLLKQLSAWQAEYFRPMISENVLELWQSGLESELYTLKLCGSGGGGFVLGFTHDYEKTRLYFKSLQKEIVPVYQVTTGNLA